ncbi:SEC-C motif domain protein [Pseudogulbenkiania sp. NH8B]|uniref:YchJ family protein n=1 Tax=Pseudogulbenkiania sp. (strain NH8B) TaxID=748280 RepID=UPI000227997D|nr:YchJ family metal-binding protein [Pseudogulbenkiania sp. NH8B]BAK77943.1 SEC-C motif domain protein [Pseudogulbenkiania sp. NH8B]
MAKTPSTTLCPCGSRHPYADCCGLFIEHPECGAPTAEALMRSRYTAYTLGCETYLLATWQEATRPAGLDLADDAGKVKWLGLDIRRTEQGGVNDQTGIVEFVAHYKVGGRAHRLHETSRFQRDDGRWFYLDGALHEY